MSDPDPLLLTLPGNNWNSSIVADNLAADSDGKLGYAFYAVTDDWPSYIKSGGTFSPGYTSYVTTGGEFPPELVTGTQQDLIQYYLSDVLGSVGGFTNFKYRVSFADVATIEFQEEEWSSGEGQIFISHANVTDEDAYAQTRFPVTPDILSGTGLQTEFTLSEDPLDESNIEVRIAGAVQNPTTYSLSGTTLTFNSAPASPMSRETVRSRLTVMAQAVPMAGAISPR